MHMRISGLRFGFKVWVEGLDADDIKPVWPAWAVGALFRGRSSTHVYQLRMFSHTSVIGESGRPR